ncbi:shikimate dehydrogenase [Falsibacillus pallidus]|uniref:Shikimate dehydrogenase (NADP(+)) n=1 Tax=Falsibacillus pallidus TaxID=493781 RepID=A0A370GL06_9BACI|nr:shikimate dehydrogenase [Falsibacillus pallidus]RDI44040.1 shikimate dehydrogenase [Falsibacillus pallidus]
MEKLFGVIGDPIGHSLSPAMHNAVFASLNMKAHYHPFHIKKESLGKSVSGMKELGIAGFNVTVPHKSSIIEFLDEIDPLAEAIGAVNTVVNEKGRLKGYNTDGLGFVEALKSEWKQDLSNEDVLIIGAGGAAKAIYYTLASLGIKHISIANRNIENGKALISRCPFEVTSNVWSLEEASFILNEFSLVIQTTPIGMAPSTEQTPLDSSKLRKDAFVSDIIYNPFETKFLSAAKSQGALIQNGLGMFVNQGAVAFKLWTGIQPDTKLMKKVVLDLLGGSYANR